MPARMQQRTLNTLYTYWNELRAGRLAPRRLEVEPSRIAAILAETFMLERVDAFTYQYRLAGTRLCELFGAELRGTDFLACWPDADKVVLAHQLGTACEQGAVIRLTLEAGLELRHRMQFEALLLPLLHVGNSVGRIIGAMSLTSAPPMLGAERPRTRHLVRHEVIWPDGRPHPLLERGGGTAPFQAVRPAAATPGKSERPKLRVLDGGRNFWKPDAH
jgi:hypothetical protein